MRISDSFNESAIRDSIHIYGLYPKLKVIFIVKINKTYYKILQKF